MEIKRGLIVLVNLDPTIGSEQGKVRPALVIQNDIGNKFSPLTIIAPITSKVYDKNFPTNVFLKKEISKLNEDSTILLNQIRCIDKQRIVNTLNELDLETIKKVDIAIKKSLSL